MSGLLGTYVAFLLCLGAAALVGAAILVACGRRRWSRLGPAVGLAALCPLAWWAVRLPGEGTTAIIVLALVTAAAAAYALPRVEDLGGALRRGLPLELAAVALASLPFLVEQRFGILGTGLNPDMSQHLFAVDRFADGGSERLIEAGYPLGPHSIVAAISSIGPSTVQAFDGLSIAIAVATCLVALAPLESLSVPRRLAGALLVGFAYLLASNYVQGAFKEGIEALFVLAFAVALGELAAAWPLTRRRDRGPLRAIPLAVLAAGALYAYSFPGPPVARSPRSASGGRSRSRERRRPAASDGSGRRCGAAIPATLVGLGLLVAVAAPELGRMVDFARFETFDPAGAGLGNLFNRLSPLEALGIWPSGDFRVEPGDGAIPAIAFYLGAALAAGALAFGLRWWWRERERAVPAALAAAAVLWLYSLVAGTPYQEAKALVIARAAGDAGLGPGAARAGPDGGRGAPDPRQARGRLRLPRARAGGEAAPRGRRRDDRVPDRGRGLQPAGPRQRPGRAERLLAGLAELRTALPPDSIVVIAPQSLLDEHGRDYLAWELRGNRICVIGEGETPPRGAGILFAVEVDDDGAVVPGELLRNPHALGRGPCPLIPDAARADPSADG